MRCDQRPIVMDNGTGFIKVGFSGEDQPEKTIKNSLYTYSSATSDSDIIYSDKIDVDGRALQDKDYLTVTPMRRGIINDWDGMVKLWNHVLCSTLKVNPEQSAILMTDSCGNSKLNREKITQALFEILTCHSAYISLQEVLALFSVGKKSGVVVNSGEALTSILIICEGFAVPYLNRRYDHAGHDISNLVKAYIEDAYPNATKAMNDYQRDNFVHQIKESFCSTYIDADIDDFAESRMQKIPSLSRGLDKVSPSSFNLPDGIKIDLNEKDLDLFKLCTEHLFTAPVNPADMRRCYSARLRDVLTQNSRFCSMWNSYSKQLISIPAIIHDLTLMCDIGSVNELYSNVVLAGGTTCSEHFGRRLIHELLAFYTPASTSVKIVESADPSNAAWFGGAILTSLSIFQNAWITRQDYEETGPTIIHRKCIN